jgi:hypothetical protein
MGVGSQRHAPTALPRDKPGTHCLGGLVGPRTGLDGCEKSLPHRNTIPDRPPRSKSLYRLIYSALTYITIKYIIHKIKPKHTKYTTIYTSIMIQIVTLEWRTTPQIGSFYDSFLSLINLKYNHANTCYALAVRGKYCKHSSKREENWLLRKLEEAVAAARGT